MHWRRLASASVLFSLLTLLACPVAALSPDAVEFVGGCSRPGAPEARSQRVREMLPDDTSAHRHCSCVVKVSDPAHARALVDAYGSRRAQLVPLASTAESGEVAMVVHAPMHEVHAVLDDFGARNWATWTLDTRHKVHTNRPSGAREQHVLVRAEFFAHRIGTRRRHEEDGEDTGRADPPLQAPPCLLAEGVQVVSSRSDPSVGVAIYKFASVEDADEAMHMLAANGDVSSVQYVAHASVPDHPPPTPLRSLSTSASRQQHVGEKEEKEEEEEDLELRSKRIDRIDQMTGALAVMRNIVLPTGGMPGSVSSTLDGAGELVEISDTGLDIEHVMFRDSSKRPIATQAISPSASDTGHDHVRSYAKFMDVLDVKSGHGSHVAGIVTLVAPRARIFLFDISCSQRGGCACPPSIGTDNCECASYSNKKCPSDPGGIVLPYDMADINEPAYASGVRVSSSSFGTVFNERTFPQTYDDTSLQIDRSAVDHPDLVIVWAGGNAGQEQGKDGRGVDSFVSCKNCITVGNCGTGVAPSGYQVTSPDAVHPSSTRGPTVDGRLMPLVVAPGACVYSASALSGDQVECKTGTSMAAPATAGAASLLRQFFRDHMGIPSAPSSLIRAALINTAVFTTLTPSFASQGFGRINVSAFVDGAPDGLVHVLSADTASESVASVAQERRYEMRIPAALELKNNGVVYLCATLSWTDPTNFANARHVLVNDLDLSLAALSPGGSVLWRLLGNHFLQKEVAPDRKNNNERICASVHTQMVSAVRLVVRASTLALTPQAFSLVVTWSTTSLYALSADPQPNPPPPKTPKPQQHPPPTLLQEDQVRRESPPASVSNSNQGGIFAPGQHGFPILSTVYLAVGCLIYLVSIGFSVATMDTSRPRKQKQT